MRCYLFNGWTGLLSRYSGSLRIERSGDRIPVGARFSAPVQTGPWGTPSLLYNGYRVFLGGKVRPGRDADPSPLLVPRLKYRRTKPLLSLRAFVACETVKPVCLMSIRNGKTK